MIIHRMRAWCATASSWSRPLARAALVAGAVLAATLPAGAADAADPIVFSAKRPSSTLYRDVYIIQPDGTNRQQITSSYDYNGDPVWSPSGDRIAFVRAIYELNSNIWLMSASGGQQQNVTNLAYPISAQSPAWAPNGTRIAYASTQGNTPSWEIWATNTDGSNQTRLTHDSASYTSSSGTYVSVGNDSPHWSWDGARIVFVKTSRTGNVVNSDIYAMQANGTGAANLTNSAASESGPKWSPDGTKIVFARGGEIWVMNANGTGQTQLTFLSATTESQPAWSPDGTRIVFTSGTQLSVMNANGSGQQVLTNTGSPNNADW